MRTPIWAAVALACIAFAAPALADTVATAPAVTTVAIPIGDWLGGAASIIAAVSAAVIAWAFRFLPASVVQILQTMQVDQLLGKAIGYAINAVAGAEKDKVLKVDVANAVVATALQYVVDHAPAWLVSWMGGTDAIEQKILARLTVEPSATLAAAGTLVVAPSAEPAAAPAAA